MNGSEPSALARSRVSRRARTGPGVAAILPIALVAGTDALA